MISSIYGFRAPPTYRDAIPGDKFRAAMEMPMSATSTFFDQSKGGVLGSVGVGTVIREALTPGGAPVRPNRFETNESFEARRDEAKPMSKDAYRLSPYFRDEVPWDEAMTEDRAASLASWYDERKIREFYAEKRPIMAFFGNLSGQALDPINYVPVAGPLVKAAAVAKLGKVAGASAAAALDAAGNTAAFGLVTAPVRSKYGDDVSWQATVSQIATAALIGAGFGSIAGALDRSPAAASRSAIEARLATLKTTQEARIALNEGIDALVRGEDVRLSPNATEPVRRVGQDVRSLQSSNSLNLPDAPTKEIMAAKSRVEDVPLDMVRGTQSKMDWDMFARGESPGALIDGYGDKPVAVRREDGEFLIFDGHHRAALAASEGKASLDMHVVDAKDYAPDRAGRKPSAQQGMSDDELLRELGVAPKAAQAETASWVIREKGSQAPVMETFNKRLVDRLNTDKYEAVPIKQHLVELNQQVKAETPVDTTPARADPPPEGIDIAVKAIAKPDDYKAMASQYRVDPDSGSFSEEADIAQLGVEGRLTEDDVAVLADAQAVFDDGAAYGEALKSVAACLV